MEHYVWIKSFRAWWVAVLCLSICLTTLTEESRPNVPPGGHSERFKPFITKMQAMPIHVGDEGDNDNAESV